MVDSDFLLVDARRLHLLDFGGSGRITLLVHAVTGSAWQWSEAAPALTSAGRAVALDLAGHGDSQWRVDGAYGTQDMAADLAAAIDVFGGGPVDYAGASWGGLIGVRLAAERPELIRRLAIVDIPPSFTTPPEDVPERPAEFAGHAEAVAAERAKYPRASEEIVETLAKFGTRPGPHGRLYVKHDPTFLERWSFRVDDRWDDLAAINCPTLLVRASDSHVLSADVAKRMADALPDGRLVELEDCGHLAHVERPRQLAALLNEHFPDAG